MPKSGARVLGVGRHAEKTLRAERSQSLIANDFDDFFPLVTLLILAARGPREIAD